MLGKDVRTLPGIGDSRAEALGRLDIRTVGHLLLHVPRDYLDRRSLAAAGELRPGEDVSVEGVVTASSWRRTSGGRRMFSALLDDGTGCVNLVFFHPSFVTRKLRSGVRVMASGRVALFGMPSISHPEVVFTGEGRSSGPGVLPVYPLTSGLGQRAMRRMVRDALAAAGGAVPEVLPPEVLRERRFASREELLRAVHSPDSPGRGMEARRVLALEELFLYQLLTRRLRREAWSGPSLPLTDREGLLERVLHALPWSLTGAQERAVRDVLRDMAGKSSGGAMRRLIQGDVGSGKTVIGALACAACSGSGMQAAVLAPTEVLATQHHRTLRRMLEPAGISCAMLTGGTPAALRREILGGLAGGSVRVLTGTHAILQQGVDIPDLALLVVDEQQRFGVEQREALLAGREPRPHLLVMTATPIPRTMAMTLYGDLDVSVIDEMPPGRGSITTTVVTGDGRKRVFELMRRRLEAGERAFVIYPLREASEEMDLRDARSSWEVLARGPLGRFGVGLLTGDMSSPEKTAVAGDFAAGRIGLLVSTTVVEVGIDVPEATVMVVANAERFGLSQLHQLRGRIGRSGRDSWCFLVRGEESGARSAERLQALVETTDGFRIAERDLEMRGPGDVAGTRQHGLPAFRVASLEADTDLLPLARSLAESPGRGGPEALRELLWRFDGAGSLGV